MEVVSIINLFSVGLAAGYAALVGLLFAGWNRIPLFRPEPTPGTTSVSVLVAARNEEAAIGRTLDALLAQHYDAALLEIIIIDDHSTDRTAEIVRAYAGRGVKLLQLHTPDPINSYKKKALETGVRQASGQLIVTTDADCVMGPRWLGSIVACYEREGYRMISSPVAYFEEKNRFERIQSLEFAYLIGLGAAGIGLGKASTCNGANLAYEREAFEEVGGFRGIDDLASGDDELLLHKIAARYPGKIGFLKSRDAVVYTQAKPNLHELIQQRKRWASKSTRYKDKWVLGMGIGIWLFNLSIFANLILALFFPQGWSMPALAIQLCLKIVAEFLFLFRIMSFFNRKQLLVLLPLLSLLHIVYLVYIGIAGNSGKYNWKNRVVR